METIITTIISSVLTLIGVIITVWSSEHKRSVDQARRDQKVDDEISQIKEKLDIHNGYAEKFASITVDIAEIKKDIVHMKEVKK